MADQTDSVYGCNLSENNTLKRRYTEWVVIGPYDGYEHSIFPENKKIILGGHVGV